MSQVLVLVLASLVLVLVGLVHVLVLVLACPVLVNITEEGYTQPVSKAVNHSDFTTNTTAHSAIRSQYLAHCSQICYR